MQREPRPEGLGLRLDHRNRSASLSTDSQQQHFPKCTILAPPLVIPQPQFIAAPAAAQIIAADQDLDTFDQTGNSGGVLVGSSALNLLNGFLDHLLFNILLAARSTKLMAIRPAVAEVLKPRLAKEVVSAADEELREYMGGGDDEELSDFHGGQEPTGHFELERSWKLTRLKCMVYTRLGDMEEEDEEDHLQREGLDDASGRPGRFSSNVGHITPAAAIFVTSILEYIGECAIVLAGEAAAVRKSKSSENQDKEMTGEDANELSVDHLDVEKLGLNATLGRLWRTWRQNTRTPMLSRTLSRESMVRRGRFPSKSTSRQSSIATIGPIDELHARAVSQEPSLSETPESVEPAGVPLPPSENDDGTESPGNTAQLAIAVPARSVRPRSLILSSASTATPSSFGPSPSKRAAESPTDRRHGRSCSMPPDAYPARFDYETVSKMPNEAVEQLETTPESDSDDEHADPVKEERKLSRTGVVTAKPHTLSVPDDGESYYDGESSCVSSIHSDAAGPAAPSDHSAGQPSPITSEEAEMLQRKAEQNSRSPANDTSSHQISDDQPTQLSKMPTIQDPQQAPSERSVRHSSGSTTGHVHYHRPGPNNSAKQRPTIETSFVSQNSKPDSQHPRLAQLREAVKAASSTPDQEYPHHYRSPSTQEPHSAPPQTHRSEPWQKTSPWSTSSTPRHGDVSTTPEIERAAVQRVGPSSRRESNASKPHRSESVGSSRDRRPKTSGSSTSQVSGKVKGLASRQRTASETSGAYFKATEEPSDLESLIQSDETIHYTLTPRTVRANEDPDSPRWTPVRSGPNGSPGLTSRSRKHSESAMTSSGRSRAGSEAQAKPVKSRVPRAPQKPVSQQPSTPKTGGLEARDATTELESLREFADFIRTTGPSEADESKFGHQPGSATSANGGARFAQSQPHKHVAAASSPRPPSTQAATPKRTGPKLQARAAIAPKEDHTSDLIDFLKEGPPDDSPRHPGVGAPSRDIMDTKKLHSSSPAASAVSMPDSSTVSKSYNSSLNSRTGLLDSTKRSDGRMRTSQPSHLGPTPSHSREPAAPVRKQRKAKDPYTIDFDIDEYDEPPRSRPTQPSQFGSSSKPSREAAAPVRKQRKARDPYAIDISDEDDEDDLAGAPAPPKEESLAEFLRNAPPPPDDDQTPQPLSVNMPPQKSRSTASAMKSRLMRNGSTGKGPKTKLSLSSFQSKTVHNAAAISAASNNSPRSQPRSQPQPQPQPAPRPRRSYSHQDAPPANGGNYSRPAERPRNGGNTPRVPDTPRGPAGGYQSETAALADFLKNTGPPEPPQTGVRSSNSSIDHDKESSSKLGRMFLRKKKQDA